MKFDQGKRAIWTQIPRRPQERQEKTEHTREAHIVTTLRLRIKTLEEKNRELTELLERAYGVTARKD